MEEGLTILRCTSPTDTSRNLGKIVDVSGEWRLRPAKTSAIRALASMVGGTVHTFSTRIVDIRHGA